jgi:hypothetical protein
MAPASLDKTLIASAAAEFTDGEVPGFKSLSGGDRQPQFLPAAAP